MKCAICGFDNETVLVKHHIVPRSEGGSNDASNLVALCRNCHWLVHKGYYSLKAKFTQFEHKVILEAMRGFKNPLELHRASRLDHRQIKLALQNIALKLLSEDVIKGLLTFTAFVEVKN